MRISTSIELLQNLSHGYKNVAIPVKGNGKKYFNYYDNFNYYDSHRPVINLQHLKEI